MLAKRASARQITAVIPYFGYARADRKTSGRESITAKLTANLLEKSGVDKVLAMDLHSAQIQATSIYHAIIFTGHLY
jgi:Phosphoribosylpyrophosphate synthetase